MLLTTPRFYLVFSQLQWRSCFPAVVCKHQSRFLSLHDHAFSAGELKPKVLNNTWSALKYMFEVLSFQIGFDDLSCNGSRRDMIAIVNEETISFACLIKFALWPALRNVKGGKELLCYAQVVKSFALCHKADDEVNWIYLIQSSISFRRSQFVNLVNLTNFCQTEVMIWKWFTTSKLSVPCHTDVVFSMLRI